LPWRRLLLVLQERRSTGEVSCQTEAPSVAWLPTGVEEGAGEGACTAPEEATCTPAAAGAEQDRRPTSDPACREAAAERIIFPTRSAEATCVHHFSLYSSHSIGIFNQRC
jgi:hypothetical protein